MILEDRYTPKNTPKSQSRSGHAYSFALQSLPLYDHDTTREPSSSKVVTQDIPIFVAEVPPTALVYAVFPTKDV